MGQRRDLSESCHNGKLGDPVYAELAEAAVQAYEAGAFDPQRNPRGRNGGAGIERGGKACDLSRGEEHFAVVRAALAFATASAGEDAALFVNEDGEVGACGDVCAVLKAKNGRVDERERAHATGAASIVAPRIHGARLVQCERVRRRRGDLIESTRPIIP